MAFSIAVLVIVAWLDSIFAGRDDGLSLLRGDGLKEWVSIIGLVGNDIVKVKGSEQSLGLRTVMSFTTGEDEA